MHLTKYNLTATGTIKSKINTFNNQNGFSLSPFYKGLLGLQVSRSMFMLKHRNLKEREKIE